MLVGFLFFFMFFGCGEDIFGVEVESLRFFIGRWCDESFIEQ